MGEAPGDVPTGEEEDTLGEEPEPGSMAGMGEEAGSFTKFDPIAPYGDPPPPRPHEVLSLRLPDLWPDSASSPDKELSERIDAEDLLGEGPGTDDLR